MAKHLKIRPQSLSLYRTGETQPNAEKVLRIAEYFGVTVDYLLTGYENDEGLKVSQNIWKQDFYERASKIAVLCSNAEDAAHNLMRMSDTSNAENEVE